MLTQRTEAKAKDFINRTQFGFRRGCGTRDAIGVMRWYAREAWECGCVMYAFVDLEKAFDRVNWVKMMETLKALGIDWRDRRMIHQPYMNQNAVVRVVGGESEPGSDW